MRFANAGMAMLPARFVLSTVLAGLVVLSSSVAGTICAVMNRYAYMYVFAADVRLGWLFWSGLKRAIDCCASWMTGRMERYRSQLVQTTQMEKA